MGGALGVAELVRRKQRPERHFGLSKSFARAFLPAIDDMPDDADSGVRHLVLVHGRDRARSMVQPEQKALVDIAAEVLADEDAKIGISYSGFCLTSLPHKALPDEQTWEKRAPRVFVMNCTHVGFPLYRMSPTDT